MQLMMYITSVFYVLLYEHSIYFKLVVYRHTFLALNHSLLNYNFSILDVLRWVNQAYSRLSTTHGHITDCKLDSVVYVGVCVVI